MSGRSDDQGPRSVAKFTSVAPDSGSHRREHPRVAVDLDVHLGSEHNFYAGLVENLSAGGVFVATHSLRPVGEKVEVSINLPDGAQVKAKGEVRWVRVYNEHSDMPPGMGIRFEELNTGAESAIEKFLEKREPLFFDDE